MKSKHNAEDFISDLGEYGLYLTQEEQQSQDENSIVDVVEVIEFIEVVEENQEEQSYKSEEEEFTSDFNDFEGQAEVAEVFEEYNNTDEIFGIEDDISEEEYDSKDYNFEPSSAEILKEQYSLLGAVSQFLFGNSEKLKSKEEFNCPRREKLAHKTEGCSTPVSSVNQSLDEQGIPLTKRELAAFSAQLKSQKKSEGATKDKVIDLVHEKQIIKTLKKTADKKRQEGELLKESGLLDKDKAEVLRKDISVAEAGSRMHSIFRFLKSPMNGAGVAEDTLGDGVLLSQMYDDTEREMKEEAEGKERDYIPK